MTERAWVVRLRQSPTAAVVLLTHVAIAAQFLSAYWRPTFVRDDLFALTLGLLVFSFLSAHSGIFLSSLRGGATTARVVAAVLLLGFYSLFVVTFGITVLDNLPITLLFLLQMAARAWGAVRGRTDATNHEMPELFVALALLIVSGILAHILPFFPVGVPPEDLDRLGGEGDLFWHPHEAVLFGLLFTLGSVAFEVARLRDPNVLSPSRVP